MDWGLFGSTFATIFIAELGDKTQFAAMAASAGTKSTGTVLAAAILALSLASILGVAVGRSFGAFLQPEVTKWISGILFILIGLWTLFRTGA